MNIGFIILAVMDTVETIFRIVTRVCNYPVFMVLVKYVLDMFWFILDMSDISYVFLTSSTEVSFRLAYVDLMQLRHFSL
jgi:hypothetical protein